MRRIGRSFWIQSLRYAYAGGIRVDYDLPAGDHHLSGCRLPYTDDPRSAAAAASPPHIESRLAVFPEFDAEGRKKKIPVAGRQTRAPGTLRHIDTLQSGRGIQEFVVEVRIAATQPTKETIDEQ